MLQDDLMPISHYCVSCVVAHSTQNQVQGGLVDLQESQQRHSIYIVIPRHIKTRVSERALRSIVCRPTTGQVIHHSPGQTSRDEPFVVLRKLSGTRCLETTRNVAAVFGRHGMPPPASNDTGTALGQDGSN